MCELRYLRMKMCVCVFYEECCAQYSIHVRKEYLATGNESNPFQKEYAELKERIRNVWLRNLTKYYIDELAWKIVFMPKSYLIGVCPSKAPHRGYAPCQRLTEDHFMDVLCPTNIWRKINDFVDYRLIYTGKDSDNCVGNIEKTSNILDDDSMIIFKLEDNTWKTYRNGEWVTYYAK